MKIKPDCFMTAAHSCTLSISLLTSPFPCEDIQLQQNLSGILSFSSEISGSGCKNSRERGNLATRGNDSARGGWKTLSVLRLYQPGGFKILSSLMGAVLKRVIL